MRQGAKAHLCIMKMDVGEETSKDLKVGDARMLDLLPKELPKKLPPKRPVDHKIELVPGAEPPAKAPYCMDWTQLQELKKQLQELQEQGFIRPIKSPYGTPVLFVRKKDGSARMCMDYRALNKITIRNRYPVPLVDDLLDQLAGAKYFTRIDLRSGYHQICIAEEDIEKTAFRTQYGSFEWLVLAFGLTNAPSAFCTMGNVYFGDMLDDFLIMYIDDLLIYSKTWEEHEMHVRKVLDRLWEHELFAKPEKCEWGVTEVDFLGFKVTSGV